MLSAGFQESLQGEIQESLQGEIHVAAKKIRSRSQQSSLVLKGIGGTALGPCSRATVDQAGMDFGL